MNNNRHRPTVFDNSQVGTARHNVYKGIIDCYHRAMEAGFYIEAIALMESLMSDRMESLLNDTMKTDKFSFKTIGYLANEALNNATIAPNQVIVDIIERIREWAKKRNNAIHEMSKLLPDDINSPFSERYASLKEITEDGYKLFRELDKEISSSRKSEILP